MSGPLRALLIAVLIAVPIALGVIVGASVDPATPPFVGAETLSAVFLLDGQAYFGHLEDIPWSGTIALRDVYYFNDASKTATDLAVGLVKRGSELHEPVDVMRIRRDKVLAIERIGNDSPVARAIAAQRALDRAAK